MRGPQSNARGGPPKQPKQVRAAQKGSALSQPCTRCRHTPRPLNGGIDMTRFLSALLFSSSVLVFSVAANAQTRGQGPYYPPRDDPYYRNDPNRGYYPDQGRYGNDRYGYGRNGEPLIGRVLRMLASTDMREGTSTRLPRSSRNSKDDGLRANLIPASWTRRVRISNTLRTPIKCAVVTAICSPETCGICASFAPRAADIRTTATGITATIRTGATNWR